MAEVVFAKERGKDRKDNLEVNLEEFIDVKGISAQGNQLTKDKVNQINLLDPLPYEAPKEVHADELEVVDEETIKIDEIKGSNTSNSKKDGNTEIDGEGQGKLF